MTTKIRKEQGGVPLGGADRSVLVKDSVTDLDTIFSNLLVSEPVNVGGVDEVTVSLDNNDRLSFKTTNITNFYDEVGNKMIQLMSDGQPTEAYMQFYHEVDGSAVTIYAGGDEADIDITLSKKGAGTINITEGIYSAKIDPSEIATSNKTFTFPNQTGIISTVTSGVVAPSSTPAALGQIYVDTALAKVYVSTGTTNSGDWTILN
jgi:hypothetical protein